MDNLTEQTIPEEIPADPLAPTESDVADTPQPPYADAIPASDSLDAEITPVASSEDPPQERTIDYEALAAEDLVELRRLVPSLRISHIGELPHAVRYGELRDRGLSVEEAFWASCHDAVSGVTSPTYDNRSHLHSAVPRGAAGNPAMMSASELRAAKELFEDLSESEIQKLYSKCRS